MTKGVRVWTTSIVAEVSSASPSTSWFLLLCRWRFSRSNSANSAVRSGDGTLTAVEMGRWADGIKWDWRRGLWRLIPDDGWTDAVLDRENKALASGSDVLRKTRRWIWESANRDHDWPAVRLLFSSLNSYSSFLSSKSRPSDPSPSAGFSSGLAK